MRLRRRGLRNWRRYHVSHWFVAVGLVVLLSVSALGGAALTHAFPSHRASLQPTAPYPKPTGVKAEGDWFQLSHFNNQTPPADARQLALQQAAKLPVSRIGATVRTGATNTTSPAGSWTPLGPQPINGGGIAESGRITALAVNPSNGNDVWAGAADGGLWHSTDGGQSWAPVTDNQPTLSIGSITIDPHVGNPYTIYVGTGEGNLNFDAYWGDGVLKSSDGGATWNLYGQNSLAGVSIARIAVDPFNSNHLYAAVQYSTVAGTPSGMNASYFVGLGESGDGGLTWGVGSITSHGGEPVTDVVFDPTRNGVAYVGLTCPDLYCLGGVYETTNGGYSWSILNGLQHNAYLQRVSLAISPNGNQLYAVMSDQNGDLFTGDIDTGTYNGTTWTWAVHPVPANMASDNNEHQWWYDNVAMVDPTISAGTTAYVGGVDLWKTTDGGVTWTNLTNAYTTGTVHPDQHAQAFLPGSSSFYLGNDGGVWSGASTGSFTDLNGGGLNITQFYGGSIGEVGSHAQLYGGAQDNGESQYPMGAINGTTTWNEVYGGDGGDTAVDYTNNANVYEELPYLGINKSNNGGVTWSPAINGINQNDPVNFIAPFEMSPTNPNTLIAGTDRVYRTTDGGNHWSAISPIFDIYYCSYGLCATTMTAVAMAPSNNNVIYAVDNFANIYVTTNGGASWATVGHPSTAPVVAAVSSIAVDPTDPNVVYASIPGFNAQPVPSPKPGQHIFKTVDGGRTWGDVTHGLPDIPFESVVVDPADHNLVVAGSDAGVFVSADAGSSWARLGVGLPNAAINQVFFDHTGGSLFVASHGRGMWEISIPLIGLSPYTLVEKTPVNTNAATQTFTLSNVGFGSTMNWTASNPPSWVNNVNPSSGSLAPGASQQVTITYNTSGYSTAQTLSGSITLTAPGAGNSPYALPVSVVVDDISKVWYFAEGHTGDSFTEYLTLENPNATSTSVSVQYLLGGRRSPITKGYTLSPNSRATITVNNEIGAPQDVSMVVTASQPIVAERPMYFTYTGLPGYAIPGGTDVLGATALNSTFDFGYLDTSKGHDTWLTILNQNGVAMDVHVSYYPAAGGSPITRLHTVSANSRGTIHVNNENLPAGSYSALVTLTQTGASTPAPGLVERPLYLVDSQTGYTGSADVVGISQPLSTWYFAEGYISPTFSERYILSNPSASVASATLTFYLPDGSTRTSYVNIPTGGQTVVNPYNLMGYNVNNSAVVTSTGGPIIAERFMSFKYTGAVGSGGNGYPGGIQGATDVLGAAAPAQLFEFAEGYSGPTFAEYLTLENPTAQEAHVTVRYLPQSGAAPTIVTYTVPANSRYTVFTNSVMPNQSFSMEVLSDQSIVAERPMYFSFTGGGSNQTGGSDVLGYAP